MPRPVHFLSLAAVLIGLTALQAGAAAISVPNASFELPDTATNEKAVDNWEVIGGRDVGVVEQGQDPFDGGDPMTSVPDGTQWLCSYNDRMGWSPTDVRSEALDGDPFSGGTTIAEGLEYTLNVAIANPPGFDQDYIQNPAMRLLKGTDSDDDPYLDDPTVMASQGFTMPAQSGDQWYAGTLTYTATSADAGQELAVSLYFEVSGNYKDCAIGFDDVQLTAVPEPATMALLGLGGLGLITRRRSR